jgi:hypothetical protein
VETLSGVIDERCHRVNVIITTRFARGQS